MYKPTLNRTSLKEQISEIILNRIIEGQLKPGDRIKELILAREFGTSQAPVREALRSLESQGYLKHKSHSGTTVIALETNELLEINQIREALEVQALSEGFTSLQEIMYRLEEKYANMIRETGPRIVDLDEQFHRIILKAYDNDKMLGLWQTLTNKQRISQSHLMKSKLTEQIPVLDDSILQAIKSGNTRKAIQQLKHYYHIWKPEEN